jgi:hypothetical protein
MCKEVISKIEQIRNVAESVVQLFTSGRCSWRQKAAQMPHFPSFVGNAVQHSKRINKIFSDVDEWIREREIVKLWEVERLKQTIETRFFCNRIRKNCWNTPPPFA